MRTNSPKKTSVSLITQSDMSLPNYGEALRLLKNTDAMLDQKKKELRVRAMKAQRGSWIAGEE